MAWNRIGCLAALSLAFVFTACGDDSSSGSSKTEQTVESDTALIENKTISGVSQKGPFVTGSVVKLYELDGKTCAQTGKSFTGKITTDDGRFSISSVTLASQYALLEANGYFRNEITGDKSNGIITLNALTDLSGRENVNVNLLTHLEYDRILYLVSMGESVSSAKKQAEAEILNAFGIKGEFVNSEDLDVFGIGDGNAALLAVSVLMLRDLSEADFTEFLAKFATDIEIDGNWDDEATKTKIADWAEANDFAGGLTKIRSNIEMWNLGTAPDFEKYVRNFWYMNFGLGECGASNKDEVLAAKNERSAQYGTQTRYICRDGAWDEAAVIEKDTYRWAAGEDGEIRLGDVTQTKKYVYDAMLKEWRFATTVEAALGGCSEAREADLSLNVGKVNCSWYICKNRKWVLTDDITVDTQGWIKSSDGDLRKGDSTDAFYKFDEAQNKWLVATHNDTTLRLNGCTTNRIGEIGKSTIDNTHRVYPRSNSSCKIEYSSSSIKIARSSSSVNIVYSSSSSGEIGKYYVCKNGDWQKAQEIEFETYGEKCTNKEVGKSIKGVVTTSNRYYCTANGWVSLMDGWSWDYPKEARLNPEINYGTMTDPRDKKVYKTVKIGNQVWMAENLDYADSLTTASLIGKSWCYDNKAENCAVTGRLYSWAAAIDSEKLASDADNPLDCGYDKTCNLPDGVQGICPLGWHLPSTAEWKMLLTAVGGKFKVDVFPLVGMVLRSQTGWNDPCNGAGTDDVGFSVIPAGRAFNGDFYAAGTWAKFWSSTEYDCCADQISLSSCDDDDAVYLYPAGKSEGFSVRCVKDDEE